MGAVVISRVAESCFWTFRHLERAESLARLLLTYSSFTLDAASCPVGQWRRIVSACGQEEDFLGREGEAAFDDGERVQGYLTWEKAIPVSLVGSLSWVRENARTLRETFSLELWESVNELWLWLVGPEGGRLYKRHRQRFYARVRDGCQTLHGIAHGTMLADEPFDFMRLGSYLERVAQTARILDVHYPPPPPTPGAESAAETVGWLQLLRACAGSEAFMKRTHRAPTGPAVAQFLVLEKDFPRSLLHSANRAWYILLGLRPQGSRLGEETADRLQDLVDSVHALSLRENLAVELHEAATGVLDGVYAVCDALHRDYFDPPLRRGEPAGVWREQG